MAGFCFMQPIIAMWACWAWGMGPSFPQVHRVTSGNFSAFLKSSILATQVQSTPQSHVHLGCLGWLCISHLLGAPRCSAMCLLPSPKPPGLHHPQLAKAQGRLQSLISHLTAVPISCNKNCS